MPPPVPAAGALDPDDPAAEANRAAWDVLAGWDKPFLWRLQRRRPVTAGSDRKMRRLIPGWGQPHTTVEGAGHFLQEDKGPLSWRWSSTGWPASAPDARPGAQTWGGGGRRRRPARWTRSRCRSGSHVVEDAKSAVTSSGVTVTSR